MLLSWLKQAALNSLDSLTSYIRHINSVTINHIFIFSDAFKEDSCEAWLPGAEFPVIITSWVLNQSSLTQQLTQGTLSWASQVFLFCFLKSACPLHSGPNYCPNITRTEMFKPPSICSLLLGCSPDAAHMLTWQILAKHVHFTLMSLQKSCTTSTTLHFRIDYSSN